MNSTGSQWALIGDQYHCHRHPDTAPFPRGEVCYACASDPGDRIDVVAQAVHDTEAIAAEGEIRSVARKAKATAEDLLARSAQEHSVAAKFYDTYLKSMRLWREMREARLAVSRDWELIEHDRRMAGIRGSN